MVLLHLNRYFSYLPVSGLWQSRAVRNALCAWQWSILDSYDLSVRICINSFENVIMWCVRVVELLFTSLYRNATEGRRYRSQFGNERHSVPESRTAQSYSWRSYPQQSNGQRWIYGSVMVRTVDGNCVISWTKLIRLVWRTVLKLKKSDTFEVHYSYRFSHWYNKFIDLKFK
jgi:hypothetical protein